MKSVIYSKYQIYFPWSSIILLYDFQESICVTYLLYFIYLFYLFVLISRLNCVLYLLTLLIYHQNDCYLCS